MKENYLEHYLDKQFNQVENYLYEIGEAFHEETVHQFRISLKKIYAVYQFLEYVFPDEFQAKKQFVHPKVPYKLLGNIRDLQVTQQVLNNYEERLERHYSKVKKYLTKKRIKRSKDFTKWLKGNKNAAVISDDDKDAILKQSRLLSDNDIVSKAKTFSIQLVEEVHELIPSNDNKTWHKSRKNMRKLRFLIGIIKNIDRKIVNNEAYNAIKKTGSLLGDWHDRIVLKRWVDEYILNKAKSNRVKQLKRIIKKDRKLMLHKSERLISQLNKQEIFIAPLTATVQE